MTFQSPLKWPDGWARGQARPPLSAGRFQTTFEKSKKRLFHALNKLGAEGVVVSSNMATRLDGTPRGDTARRYISDNGVAVYFSLKGKSMVMARDAYNTPFDNFHSLTMALEYLQGLERHGGATMLERAFDGFTALSSQSHWRDVLGFRPQDTVDRALAESRYKEGAKRLHADTGANAHDAMVKLNAAIAQARQELPA